MGSQIACEYALAGHEVGVVAPHPNEAALRIRAAFILAGRVGHAVPDLEQPEELVDLDPRLDSGWDIVVESVPEDIDLKERVLTPIARAAPQALIATNTSSLSITELAGRIGAPHRLVGTHYWDPPLLMPLVEVIVTEETPADVLETVTSLLRDIGKQPVVVKRDVPGFVWNRIQLAVLREALWLVRNGVASPETVDTVMRDGLARRWRHVGPFETAGIGGIDTWLRISDNLVPELSRVTKLGDFREVIPGDAGALRAARDRRDSMLVAEREREVMAVRRRSEADG